jgi:hypothetical protein
VKIEIRFRIVEVVDVKIAFVTYACPSLQTLIELKYGWIRILYG